MSCVDCRALLSGLTILDDQTAIREVSITDGEAIVPSQHGLEIVVNRRFNILPAATVNQIAAELVAEAFTYIACASIELLLQVSPEKSIRFFRDAPLRLQLSRVQGNLRRAQNLGDIGPKLVGMTVVLRCYNRTEPVLRVQKSELHPNHTLLVQDLPLSEDAKNLVRQLKHWFQSQPAAGVLAKHFLAGLLITHLIDDLKIFMQHFPDFCSDFSWTFLTNYASLRIERILYCKQSAFLLEDPEMTILVNEQGQCHSHRLHSKITGVRGITFDLPMKPASIPLSLALRIKGPHAIRRNPFEIGLVAHRFCPSLKRRQTEFHRRMMMCSAVLVGKARQARKKIRQRLHEMYMPGSTNFYDAKKRFSSVPATKWSLLRYLGYNDLWRMKRQQRRRLKLRFLCSCRVRR
jgi:hypothetical protein